MMALLDKKVTLVNIREKCCFGQNAEKMLISKIQILSFLIFSLKMH